MTSAAIQEHLWGIHARDWAAFGEQLCLPLLGAALDAAHVTAGTRLLDAGCGAGLLALLAHLRGAQVTALDAAPTLLAVVRERVPAANVREGDLEALPFADAGFDAVTAVNSIFYAADMAAAARELARAVRPDGRVVITAWGPPERSEVMTDLFSAVASLLPPPPPGKPAKPGALSQPGELAAILQRAGLRVVDAGEVECPFCSRPPRFRGGPTAALARISSPSRTAARMRSGLSSPKSMARTRARMGPFATGMSFSGRQASGRSSWTAELYMSAELRSRRPRGRVMTG
jgi:SAM-dependent methyltransferase